MLFDGPAFSRRTFGEYLSASAMQHSLLPADPPPSAIAPGAEMESNLSDAIAIPVEKFGADPSAPDNTAAINSALDYIRSQIHGSSEFRSAGGRTFLDFAGGVYRCLGSIDATRITGTRMWGLRFAPGSMIYSEAEGKVAFDMYQSRFCYLDNFSLYGSFERPPAVGLFLSHGTSRLNGTGEHLLTRCRVNGCFSKTALYNYSCEEVLFQKCFFSNGYDGVGTANAYAACFTARNCLEVGSEFVPVRNPADEGKTRQTFNGTTCVNCEFIRRTTTLDGTARGEGPALLVDDASTFRAWSYVRQWGAHHPAVRLRSSGGLRNLILNVIIEGDSAEGFPHYEIDATPGTTIRDLEIVDHNHWKSGPLMFIRKDCHLINGLRIRKPFQRHKPSPNVEIFSVECSESKCGPKPSIYGAEIYNTSPLAADDNTWSTTPSIRLSQLEVFHGIIHGAGDHFVEPDPVRPNFSGVIFGSRGARYFPSIEIAIIIDGEVTFSSSLVAVQSEVDKSVELRTINRLRPFPFEKVDFYTLVPLTFLEDGNIRLSTGASKHVSSGSSFSAVWRAGERIWMIV